MSFEVHISDQHFQVTFPQFAYDQQRLAHELTQLPHDVSSSLRDTGEGLMSLDLKGTGSTDNNVRSAASQLFARLNGYPYFADDVLAEFRNASAPLISCILLLPFNDLFARRVILPSIIQTSQSYPIEIIIVFAGFGVDRQPFEHLRCFNSELTCITKGYNLGLRQARGEYVALFHDDCYLSDPEWIPKAMAALRDDVVAVTPEFDHWQAVPVAKAVPLVAKRRELLELGGYDEYYYAGVEDMDLTVTMLAAGLRAAPVNIGYRHLRGMGTSLILHERPHQLKLLYGYQVLPAEMIKHVHPDMMQRLLSNGFVRMLEGDYHLHFLDKFEALLAERFAVDVARMRHAYQLMRYPYLLTPEIALISNRAKLLDAYRGMMNIADLERPLED